MWPWAAEWTTWEFGFGQVSRCFYRGLLNGHFWSDILEMPLQIQLCVDLPLRLSVEMALRCDSRTGPRKKKLNLSRPSRRNPHPSPQKKQQQHATLQQQSQTNNKHYLNIFIIYLFIIYVLVVLLLKRCVLLLLFLRGGVKAASGGPRKI